VDPTVCLLARCSCWHQLNNAVVWLLRFKSWIQSKRQKNGSKRLDVEDLQMARLALLRCIQVKNMHSLCCGWRRGDGQLRSNTDVFHMPNIQTIGQRGTPEMLRSDQETNIIGGEMTPAIRT